MKISKYSQVCAIALVGIGLVGCGSQVLQVNKMVNPGSKFQPTMATPADVDKYIALVSAENGKIVFDEQGSYFHNVTGDTLVTAYLHKEEDNVLRSLFSESVGVVTPVYTFSVENGRLKMVVDWKATQRRHAVFSNEIKLKVLPFDATKRYLAALEAEALDQTNQDSWNFKTSSKVLERAGLKADYFIQSSNEEFYFANYPTFKRTGGALPNVGDLNYAKTLINTGSYNVGMVPVSLSASSVSGSGNSHMESRCGILKLAAYKKELEEAGKKSAISIFKVTYIDAKTSDTAALRKAAAEAKENELPNAKKALMEVLANQDRSLQETDRACVASLAAFRITGAFGSSRLK